MNLALHPAAAKDPTCPASAMSEQNDLLEMAGTQANGLPFSPQGLHVLAVDDDKLCLKVIAKMLQQCHYEGNYTLCCP